MDSLNFVTSLRGLITDQLAEVHTSLPARITGVDYGAKTVVLEAIVKNRRGVDDEITYPTMYDVPLIVAGGGTGRISFPVKTGDVGVVIFSERDPSNALQTDGSSTSSAILIQPCGLYPIAFIPKIATGSDSTESIDSNNVVISNNKQTYGEFSPEGVITLRNASGLSIKMDTSSITMMDGTGTLILTGGNLTFSGGTANINGLQIDKGGNLTDGNGIKLNTHTHPVTGIETGSGTVTSQPPTA